MTLVLTILKLYFISVIQGSMTIYNPTFGMQAEHLKMTFLFGLLIFGSIVDNVSNLLPVTLVV